MIGLRFAIKETHMPTELGRRDRAAILTLNRPEALNALSFAVLREIEARVTEVERSVADGDVRALLVTGAGGRAFCAGADIKELMGRTPLEHRQGLRFGQTLFERISNLPVPSIALIDGFALGGGLELAMACTFRLATAAARMGLPEIKLGLVPGYGGTQRLPRLVGEANALDIVMTGRMVRADEGLSMGLVNRIVEGDPIEAGLAFAAGVTGYSLPVLGLARDAVRRALDLPVHEGFEVEADLGALSYQTADAQEGMSAFIEKRPPEFRDG